MKPKLSAFLITTMKAPLSLLSCFILVLTLCSTCFGNQNSDSVLCIPTERLALIDLKNNLTDQANRLHSWVGEDCCSWSGVVCDNITGHVHEVHLRGPDLDDYYELVDTGYIAIELVEASRLGGTISPSVINLLRLRHLDLSSNNFGGSLIPAFMDSFQNLMYLNLSHSNFVGEIPHQLGNISTLRVLDLGSDISPGLHSKSLAWLKNLKGLLYLDMDGISLENASDWFSVVSNLTSLVELHFSSCSLQQSPSNLTTEWAVGGYWALLVLMLLVGCCCVLRRGWPSYNLMIRVCWLYVGI